ncbi:DUF2972 domain-containing protein [Helicobacter ganmani]|uniref:DUF2972 domain-containing protein n=3 Tax=Helicobacter TaxID=209 RepID=UPI003A8B1722
MSIGSKFYKRFGLKFVLAYRIRKTKRKILREVWIQKILMFYGILKLQRDFKAFKIYQTLREQNTLIVNPKNLQFIISYYDIILQWLNSKEFKEQYITTNHPYPPLLNPKRLNVKESHFKDFIVSASDCFDLDLCSKGKFADTESRNDESQSKSIDSIQPYPNLSYESIPAELAWDLNLPLVRGYNGIWLYNSCSGGEATEKFFSYCSGVEFCTICWKFKEYKNAYIYLYQNYLEGKNIIFSFNAWQSGAEKFANLLDKKVPLFSIARDYISRLKTGVNHIIGTEPITNRFKFFSLEDKILFPQIYYRGVYKNKPDINIIQKENFSLQWGDFGGLKLKLEWLKNAISKIYFISIDEISGERAFYTFVDLSKKLNFNVSQNSKAFGGKVNRYEGLLMLPCILKVNIKDISKISIGILITTHQLHPNQDEKLIDIMNLINIEIPQENLVLYVKQEEFEVLTNNKVLLQSIQEYFERYFMALKNYIKSVQENLFGEQDILNYFKSNPKLALEFKRKIRGDIEIIKANRPDIVESWKYYQEFERMCEEMDK